MKISIIMPTYNDAKLIQESIDSILIQNYKNWELIIVDDGSTDDTKIICNKIIVENANNNIKYFYQKNQDQLNAIYNYSDQLTGDYIYILHSDDLFYDGKVLGNVIQAIENEQGFDAYYTDLDLVDSYGKLIGVQTTFNYKNKKKYLPTTMLWLGRNILIDVAFIKREVFQEKVRHTYLKWNMPFWINTTEGKLDILKLKKLNINTRKYRISEENYINSEIGIHNVINGELRTLITLMKEYRIPFYTVQYYVYRVFVNMKIAEIYSPIYFGMEEKHKSKIIDFAIRKRFQNGYSNELYLNALYHFYKNDTNRTIKIKKMQRDIVIYQGKDMRAFNNSLLDGSIDDFYCSLFGEMIKGFNKVIVDNKQDKEKFEIICKFLCIEVRVEVRDE